ncbi:hypothetical protein, partial [Actinoplanes campanulatus]
MTARRSILVAALLNAPGVVALWGGRTLELTPVAVGGVAVGGSARAAERVLRRALSAPDRIVQGGGCELDPDAEPRRHLIWGALTVTMAPAGNRLVGWTVGAGRLPDGVHLPHDVTTATTVRKALRTIPGDHPMGRRVPEVLDHHAEGTADDVGRRPEGRRRPDHLHHERLRALRIAERAATPGGVAARCVSGQLSLTLKMGLAASFLKAA